MKRRQASTRIVRPLRSGQITIPAEFRRRLGLSEDSLLQVTLQAGELRIRPVQATGTVGGSPWLKELYDLFAPVRRETQGKSDEDVNAAIDAAVQAAREKHLPDEP